MEEQEQTLFDQYEKETWHRVLVKSTELLAKVSGLSLIAALILLYADSDKIGYPVLEFALGSLLVTLLFAIAEEVVRRKIQKKVDRELGR